MSAFHHYPDVGDEKFEEKLFKKLEFLRNWVGPDFQNQTMGELCRQEEFMLKPEQDFLRIYMSPATPYNSLLIFWGAGVGKTCAAISIAENFKESVVKHGKKIFVTVPQKTLEQNFIKGIYSIEEEKLEQIPGSRQCTGITYRPPDEIKGDEERQKWVDSKIRESYHISGYRSLANSVDAGELFQQYGGNVGQIFENSVVIVDEAHRLTGEHKIGLEEGDGEGGGGGGGGGGGDKAISERPLIKVLEEACRTAKNMKLVLMTATPMRDSVRSLVQLFNLLRINDGREPMDEGMAFEGGSLGRVILSSPNKRMSPARGGEEEDSEFNVVPNEEYIRRMTRGYVSYVRGENPITFAPIKDPDLPESLMYCLNDITHRPRFYHKEGASLEESYVDQMNKLTLCRCPMSEYQWYHYCLSGTTNNRNIGNLCLPGYEVGERMNSAFERLFKVDWNDAHPHIKSPDMSNFDIFKMENLGAYSRKFWHVMQNIKRGRGLHYCYSEYLDTGVVSIAMALEMAGFTWYNPNSPDEVSRLIMGGADHVPRCCANCGFREVEHDQGEVDWCAGFVPARYAIVTGRNKEGVIKQTLDRFNRSDNRYGAFIKAIIGSDTSATGVDYVALQHVHIVEPWHNYTRIYQAIGRATRHCKHIDLEESERYVNVYRYCSTVPDWVASNEEIESPLVEVSRGEIWDSVQAGDINLDDPIGVARLIDREGVVRDKTVVTVRKMLMASADEIYYIRSIRKDRIIKRVERLLKEGAIDCGLFRNMNYLPKYDDSREGTRACDYASCNYTCTYMPPLTDKGELAISEDEINRDTYYLHHSGSEVDIAIRGVIELIKRYKVLTLPFIIERMREDRRLSGIDSQNIMEALDRIVGRGEYGGGKPIKIRDQYGQEGVLIMSGIYYLYQPVSLLSKLDPYVYRMLPPKSFVDTVDMNLILKAYRKPIIDSGKLNEDYSLLMNTFFSKVRDYGRRMDAKNEFEWNICVIMAWELRSGSIWNKKRNTLWEILWKSYGVLGPQEQFFINCLAQWLEKFGIWFPSIEVHLLQQGGKNSEDIVPRCFKELHTTSQIKSLRETKMVEYQALAERKKGSDIQQLVMVYSREGDGFKLLRRDTTATSGKTCTSFTVGEIEDMMRAWTPEENTIINRHVGAGLAAQIRTSNGVKSERCVIIEFIFLTLELATKHRYVQHYYTQNIKLLTPIMVE